MRTNFLHNPKIKKKYFKFIRSQETTKDMFGQKIKQLNTIYIPLCDLIFKKFHTKKNTQIIGLSGGQGSGKSTISKILKIILKEKYKLNVAIISIDDFYKTLKERKKMSKKISGLFLTRGVPGTHDTRLLYNSLKKLNFKPFSIPKFDKSKDNRCDKNRWLKIKKKPDIIIFEGWCVGANSQPKNSLIRPINELERKQDKNLNWRKKVNLELKSKYKKIFDLINLLIFLKVPSFKYVYLWRALQEKKLRTSSKGNKVMNNLQIKKFIMFYERITRDMLKTLPMKSKVLISIDESHCLYSMKVN